MWATAIKEKNWNHYHKRNLNTILISLTKDFHNLLSMCTSETSTWQYIYNPFLILYLAWSPTLCGASTRIFLIDKQWNCKYKTHSCWLIQYLSKSLCSTVSAMIDYITHWPLKSTQLALIATSHHMMINTRRNI
jgi:hypothetical protein